MLKAYSSVVKPERTLANVMTTAAGFLFACKWHVDWPLLIFTLAGTTLIVMSACAANNYSDRGIDARMPRTKTRPTATGEVTGRSLLILTIVLGLMGFAILAVHVNWLTVWLGVAGYIDYVVLYGLSKRRSVHSTLIGTISGAVPLMAGYTAVTDHFGITALLLGLIMVFWQMPHFYAIGIFRLGDYEAGHLPIWPIVKGIKSTQKWILVYTFLYLLAALSLTAFSSAGITYAVVASALGLYWLYLGLKGFKSLEATAWARGMFGFSLINLLVLSAVVALAPLLP